MSEERDIEREKGDAFLREQFANWTPREGAELWAKIDDSLDLETQFKLNKKQFESWKTSAPTNLWETIHQALNEEQAGNQVKQAFDDWEVLAPQNATNKVMQTMNASHEVEWAARQVLLPSRQRLVAFNQLLLLGLALVLAWYTRDMDIINYQQEKDLYAALLKTRANNVKKLIDSSQGNDYIASNQHTTQTQFKSTVEVNDWLDKQFKNSESTFEIAANKETRVAQEHEPVNLLKGQKLQVRFECNIEYAEVLHLKKINQLRKQRPKFGFYLASSSHIVHHSGQGELSSHGFDLGYEAGLILAHPTRFFEQEYMLSFQRVNQIENDYVNGKFQSAELTITGLKLSTFSKRNLFQTLAFGAGLSVFTPTSSSLVRKNTIIGMPDVGKIQMGFNVGLDWSPSFLHLKNKFLFSFKYESIRHLSQQGRNQIHQQNMAVGVKFKF